MVIVFLMCRRHHYQRNGHRGKRGSDVNSVGIGGSRENFLRQEVDAMTGGDEGPPSSWVHGGAGTAGSPGAMMLENHGSVPALFPSLSCFDGHGIDGNTGATSGGFGSGASDESAGMYPPQSHAHTASVFGVEDIKRSCPSPPLLHLQDSAFRSSSPPDHMSSPTQPLASYSYSQQPQDYLHPYQTRTATSGHMGSVGTGQTDPFGDAHGTTTISSLSGHGHHNTSSEAVVSLGDSSSRGHRISSGGHSNGTGSAGGMMTSCLGYGMGMSGGLRTSSSSHGHGGISPVRSRSKSNSPTTELEKLSPSSYVRPRSTMAESDESSESGGSKSSGRGLLRKLKSIPRTVKSRERERMSERRWRPHAYGLGPSGGVNSGDNGAMSKRSTPIGGLSAQSNHHGVPSSLLNPPNAIPIPPPRSPMAMQRNDIVSPIPSIQDPKSSMDTTRKYHLFTVGPEYGSHDEFEVEDVWTPPTIGGHLLRSPSPVSTETSSYVEGLLNPRMLPGGGGGGGVNSGSGVSEAAKYQVSRGIYSNTGSMGSGAGFSLRNLCFAPGQGQHDDRLEIYHEGGRGSAMSLRDNVDYSRPISGNMVMDRSTTTFGTDFGGDGGTVATSPSPVPTSGGDGMEALGDVSMTATTGLSVRGAGGGGAGGMLLGSKKGGV